MSDHADIGREESAARDWLIRSRDSKSPSLAKAHASTLLSYIDALVKERGEANASVKSSGEFWLERVKAAEGERDAAREEAKTYWHRWDAEVKAVTEEVGLREAAEAERDEARRERDKALLSVEGLSKRLTIAVAAEDEVARLREALTGLVDAVHRANIPDNCGCQEEKCPNVDVRPALDRARAALAAPTKEDTDE